jgi:hypothetical protein
MNIRDASDFVERIENNREETASKNRAKFGALPVDLLRRLLDRRNLSHAGAYAINLSTGEWRHSATGVRGSDVASLSAYLGEIQSMGGGL